VALQRHLLPSPDPAATGHSMPPEAGRSTRGAAARGPGRQRGAAARGPWQACEQVGPGKQESRRGTGEGTGRELRAGSHRILLGFLA